ncbi:MAG: porin [Gemmatimonadales bacterium]
MTSVTRGSLAILLFSLALMRPERLTAQVPVHSRAQEITITGRVHTQFNTTSADGEIDSEFLMRRVRLTGELHISDFVSGKVQPDFGEGKITLKDAYLRLTFDPAFRATLGQFKRPFDLFELTSSTQILVIERAGGIRGLSTCSGPGGICSLSRFTEKLGYSDRDIGVLIDGRDPSRKFRYMLSATNGAGANKDEENDRKSFGGRAEFTPMTDLRVSGNVALHDYSNDTTAADEYAVAFGGDLEWGNYTEGIHLKVGAVAGDNWRNLSATGDPSKFLTAQGIVSYKYALAENRFLGAVEPVARVSWGDPDTDASDDEGLLFTPGLVIHFTGRNKIALNVDVWSPSQGNTEWSLKVQSYLHF